MTKKHFEALADALAEIRPPCSMKMKGQRDMWIETVKSISLVCKRFNSNFDRERFETACIERKSYAE